MKRVEFEVADWPKPGSYASRTDTIIGKLLEMFEANCAEDLEDLELAIVIPPHILFVLEPGWQNRKWDALRIQQFLRDYLRGTGYSYRGFKIGKGPMGHHRTTFIFAGPSLADLMTEEGMDEFV